MSYVAEIKEYLKNEFDITTGEELNSAIKNTEEIDISIFVQQLPDKEIKENNSDGKIA